MSAEIVTPAILLRATAYGESDRVVTLLGRSTGRVSALAKGARKSQRRFSGGLGLAALGEATLRERGGAELLILESFDVREARAALGADLAKTAHAAYTLELCERLSAPRHAEPELYDWLAAFLGRLEAGVASAVRLRVFELGMLQRLGLGAVVDGCASCGRADLGEEPVRWHPAQGGILCRDCARQGSLLMPGPRRALERLARTSLEEGETLSFPRDVALACREAMMELLRHHIPTPLKSLEFIAKLGA